MDNAAAESVTAPAMDETLKNKFISFNNMSSYDFLFIYFVCIY